MDEPNEITASQDDPRTPLAEQRAAALSQSRRLQATHKQLTHHNAVQPDEAIPTEHPPKGT